MSEAATLDRPARPTLEPVKLLIAGEYSAGASADAIFDPSTGQQIATVAHASPADVSAALDSSAAAFKLWRSTPAVSRGEILHRAAQLLRERTPAVAEMLTLEQGKPLLQAKIEVQQSIEIIEWYAAEAGRAYGRIIPSRTAGGRQMVLPEPIGPVAAFTPWNFPLLLAARKVAPALAAGCTCILKPSEETPASVLALGQALTDAGLPAGVLNILYGDSAAIAEQLIASPVIRKVTFTGSVSVGKLLATQAAAYVKPCTLELGGHAPVIVMDDVDIAQTAAICSVGKLWNTGQVCTAPTRFYVHEAIYEQFAQQFATELLKRQVGDGFDPKTRIGPLTNARRVAAMEAMVGDARTRGANVMAGGARIGDAGYFYQPTLLADLPVNALAMVDEPFGPLAIVSPFASIEEALERANRSEVGLAGYAFTKSHAAAVAITEGLEVGAMAINSFAVSSAESPFGGVKQSGYGYEGGLEGLSSYLHYKYVNHA